MKARDAVELVRLPAVLTIPGDSLAGGAAAGWPYGKRGWAMPAASACFYLAGMALNDYADRELDAVERPERPIPSGRVRPGEALALAAGLTGAGLGIATAVGGRAAVRIAVPVAAAAWTYDLAAKDTPAGPAVMAAARGLDVLLGAGGRPRRAALPASAVAGHTLGVTSLSRGEVHGGSRRTGLAALATTASAATAAAVAALPRRRGRRGDDTLPTDDRRRAVAGTAFAATYAGTVGRAQAGAARTPDAATVRTATGAGVRGVIGLHAALVAGTGAIGLAGGLLAAGPIARLASKVVSPT
ncbi:SCO3242 family prenyltransferase [Prauserella halophila]|uniref:SCO3242 family prenyltransferase n=2 Tax=Prauserella halophila TaxID=185641 RepID=UPI0020A58E8E|nr:UbiA family prenyltransferase [Prauserella halophila]MCP2238677.1 4-hydroxybenzoate polyprenyltransferase [Prauserella halophila]